jgi:hypothetical protein
MTKLVLSFVVAALLLPGTVAGQSHGQSKSTKSKVSTISGKVSRDGKGLIGKNDQSWSVANAGALAGHEGQQVKVKCQISPGSHEIFVLSAKTVATQAEYAVNLGDAAFRR